MVRAEVIYLVNENSADHGIFDKRVDTEYSNTSTYAIGDYAVYEDKAYRCKTAIMIAEEFTPSHWVLDPNAYAEVPRMRYCTLKSVGYNEFYKAMAAGIEPSMVFVMDYSEYDGEKVVLWNDKRYRVVRTYTNSQMIELTVEEVTNDK